MRCGKRFVVTKYFSQESALISASALLFYQTHTADGDVVFDVGLLARLCGGGVPNLHRSLLSVWCKVARRRFWSKFDIWLIRNLCLRLFVCGICAMWVYFSLRTRWYEWCLKVLWRTVDGRIGRNTEVDFIHSDFGVNIFFFIVRQKIVCDLWVKGNVKQ